MLVCRRRPLASGYDTYAHESISQAAALIVVLRCSLVLVAASTMRLGAAPDDATVLQIRVIEGEGLAYTLGSRATRGVTVQVSDEIGKPVEAAMVSFRLPEDGPGGVFSNGSKTEIATTGSDGRVSVWGMQWNRIAGSFEIRITATKGSARAGTLCSLSLSASSAQGTRDGTSGRRIPKWVWITAGIAAGAAGMGVATAARNGSAPPVTTAAGAIRIGTPTIILGRP